MSDWEMYCRLEIGRGSTRWKKSAWKGLEKGRWAWREAEGMFQVVLQQMTLLFFCLFLKC